ncbi:lipid IV(A) 3-deoxy-D-manno-octulosonic acid transferase [Vibrio sp. WJH972]
MTVVRFIYTLLLILISPVFLWSLYKTKPGKPSIGQRWPEHFGFTPSVDSNSPIWVHAVSVGEVLAITPFIRELKKQHPELAIVLTTTTSTGAEQALKLGGMVEHRYMPLDFAWCVSRFIKTVQPSQLIIMETELWPNTLAMTAKHKVPVSVVNARLSQRSYSRYAKFGSLFSSLLGRCISHIYCQTQADADRFNLLGIPCDALTVTGSMKFDITVPDSARVEGKKLRKLLGEDRPVWIAASTHKGEDEQVLEIHRHVVKQCPEALLIIVPRHPERFDSVAKLIVDAGWRLDRRTQSKQDLADTEVYLADTMGEMFTLLCASDVCFMGGSLLGDKVGGHNLLEPAAVGIPSIIGPSYYNFKDITEELIRLNIAEVSGDAVETSEMFIRLFSDNEYVANIQSTSEQYFQKSKGSIKLVISQLELK